MLPALVLAAAAAAVADVDPSRALESRVVNGPAGKLHLDVRGAGGLPVVLIPSLAGSTRQWEPQLAHLQSKRRVIAIDLRGHGKSDSPRSAAFQPGDYSQDVKPVLFL